MGFFHFVELRSSRCFLFPPFFAQILFLSFFSKVKKVEIVSSSPERSEREYKKPAALAVCSQLRSRRSSFLIEPFSESIFLTLKRGSCGYDSRAGKLEIRSGS